MAIKKTASMIGIKFSRETPYIKLKKVAIN